MDTAVLKVLFAALESRRAGESAAVELPGADLSAAHLLCADLHGANLSGARLARAKVGGADLSGARLDAADLTGTDLTGADLRYADLTDARLGGAWLTAADLRGTRLSPDVTAASCLKGARVDPSACERSGFEDATILALARAGVRFDDLDSFAPVLREAVASAIVYVEGEPKSRRQEEIEAAQQRLSAPASRRAELRSETESDASSPPASYLPATPAPPRSQRSGVSAASSNRSAESTPMAAERASRTAIAERARELAAADEEARSPWLSRRAELTIAALGIGVIASVALTLTLVRVPLTGLLVGAQRGLALGAAMLTLALPRFQLARAAPRVAARVVPATLAAALILFIDPASLGLFRLRSTLSSGDAATRAAAARLLARSGHRSFDGQDLSALDLSGADLSQVSFHRANLTRADLSNAALIESSFDGADLSHANVRGADFSEANVELASGWELVECDAGSRLPSAWGCVDGRPVRAATAP